MSTSSNCTYESWCGHGTHVYVCTLNCTHVLSNAHVCICMRFSSPCESKEEGEVMSSRPTNV